MKISFKYTVLLSIVVISTAMHFRHFPKDLMSIHVWRQTQTQSTIVNFYEEDMNIFQPRRNHRGAGDGVFKMEFPLMQWLVAASYHVFGNHIVVTRIFMFLIGLMSVLGMFRLVMNLFANEKMALLAAWTFNFSPSFYYYTINPMPDNLALCFSIWGLSSFFYWYKNKQTFPLWLSGVLLGLGALCKLPFILYFAVPFTFFLFEIYKKGLGRKTLIDMVVAFSFVIFPLSWYAMVVPHWEGNGIIKGILDDETPIGQFLYYLVFNLGSTLPELLLNYGSLLFFLAGFFFLKKNKAYKNLLFKVLAILGVFLIAYAVFEANMIAEIHDYYLFPFYPLLFILVAYGAYHCLYTQHKWMKRLSVLLLLLLPLTAHLRMADRWSLDRPGFNKDLWTYKSELRSAVPSDALVVVGNDISQYISFYYIDKKGWVFYNDDLDVAKLEKIIGEGAAFLYSDSRSLEEKHGMKQYIGSPVSEYGSIRVFELRGNDVDD